MGPSTHLWHDEERHRPLQTSPRSACWWQGSQQLNVHSSCWQQSSVSLYRFNACNIVLLRLPCRWRVAGALALLLASKSFNVLVGVPSFMAGTLV